MAVTNKITLFVSGNGDSVLLQAHGHTVMTDINYRVSRVQDPDDDEAPDFAPEIRAACPNDHLSIFVLTHPDQDHLGGFGELFHLGSPESWDSDPDEGEVKIVVDEIWCSPYGTKPHYTTDASKPVIDEIKRRNKLLGTEAGMKDGNRLVVMTTDTHESGSVLDGLLAWRLLAPTAKEAEIPKSDDPEQPNSSNPSSLVIRWTVTIDGKDNYVLLGGDSTVDIWERIHDAVLKNNPDALAWHILLCPHHCARRSIGRVENPGAKNEKFVPSETAEAALSEQRGDGFVVSSSNRVVSGGPSPPSHQAKERYLKILARGKKVSDEDRKRFLCTGGNGDDDTPEHIEFKFSSKGPGKALLAMAFVSGTGSSSGRGGGYG